MKYLYLSYNKIAVIHPKAFWSSPLDSRTSHTRLEQIYLDNNNIDYIKSGTFDPLFNLKRILLWNNKITKIEHKLFLNILKLKDIDISYNKLTNLPIKWLSSSLTNIAIIDNDIKRLTIDYYQGAIHLVALILSPYNITIDYNIFTDLSKCTDIEMNYNNHTVNEACNCDCIWCLKTNSNSKMCLTEDNEIRKYLNVNCVIPS